MSSDQKLGFIQTKLSLLRNHVPENFRVVTYESHKAKPKKVKQELDGETKDNATQSINELDMKRARHEIFKFGMSGFDPEKKQEAKIQLAIKLGAKPPKNKYKNYKQLQQEKVNEAQSQKKRLEFDQLGKNQLGKSTAKGKFFKRKKGQSSLLEKYGKASVKDITKNKKIIGTK